jgi:hypothetical protein
MVVRGDVVLALSASGETEEILALLATIKRLRVPLIAMTGDEICAPLKDGKSTTSVIPEIIGKTTASAVPKITGKGTTSVVPKSGQNESGLHPPRTGWPSSMTGISTLAAAADVALDCSVDQEACSLDDYDACLGRCAGRHLEREAWLQGRRLRQPSSRREAGETAGAGGVADALG